MLVVEAMAEKILVETVVFLVEGKLEALKPVAVPQHTFAELAGDAGVVEEGEVHN
jgi:hypothetical protein